jgi:hypothetical protein
MQTGWGRKWPQSRDFWHAGFPLLMRKPTFSSNWHCSAGLLVSFLMMTYGVDLSPGFF